MLHLVLQRVALLALATAAGAGTAAVVTLQGALDDAANTALVASDLGAAQFTDELATANNVALYTLHLAAGGNVNLRSTGFALGGVDPYVTLFSGTDPATATFRDSNSLNATTLGGDFTLDTVLAAGRYTVAVGVYTNLSFAENLGAGVLADGFTGLGGPLYFGDGSYRLVITLPDAGTDPDPGTVPEPGSAALVVAAALAAAAATRRTGRRRQTPITHGGR